MKIKTSELEGVALDFSVARCEKRGIGTFEGEMLDIRIGQGVRPLPYSTSWAHGGPIIEREGIDGCYRGRESWIATANLMTEEEVNLSARNGESPLIAAMRCYVASKLGDEVEVPNELVQVAKKEEV